MSNTLEVGAGWIDVSVYMDKDVVLEAEDLTDRVHLFITPGEAVQLSRALVAAAAEALGVAV